MDTLDREGLKRLGASSGGRHVSIYMDTHGAAPENQQDPIRFKNLLRRAETLMIEAGDRSADVRALTSPAWQLLDDGMFWRPQPGGLAVFLSPGQFSQFRLPLRLNEQVVVNSRFYVKPLLSAVDGGEHFYVLALSQDLVRLLRGTRAAIEEVPLPEEMPRNLEDAAHIAPDIRETLSWHSSNRGGATPYGRTPAQYHHSGVDTPSNKRRIVDFFQQVSDAVQSVVRLDDAPMVLAAVDYEVPMYRLANEYQGLLDDTIVGNPKLLGDKELHARAWEIVSPLFESARRQALDRFNEYEGTGHASADASEVVRAAAYGRVDSLFVAEDAHLWGSFDAATGDIVLSPDAPGSEDLTDLAVTNTVLNGGSVFPLGVRGEPLAAVYRY